MRTNPTESGALIVRRGRVRGQPQAGRRQPSKMVVVPIQLAEKGRGGDGMLPEWAALEFQGELKKWKRVKRGEDDAIAKDAADLRLFASSFVAGLKFGLFEVDKKVRHRGDWDAALFVPPEPPQGETERDRERGRGEKGRVCPCPSAWLRVVANHSQFPRSAASDSLTRSQKTLLRLTHFNLPTKRMRRRPRLSSGTISWRGRK